MDGVLNHMNCERRVYVTCIRFLMTWVLSVMAPSIANTSLPRRTRSDEWWRCRVQCARISIAIITEQPATSQREWSRAGGADDMCFILFSDEEVVNMNQSLVVQVSCRWSSSSSSSPSSPDYHRQPLTQSSRAQRGMLTRSAASLSFSSSSL